MKAAIVLVLALVAASQARSVVPAGTIKELANAHPNMSCVLDYMLLFIHEEGCFNFNSSRCLKFVEAAIKDIMGKCFATDLKKSVKTGAQTRDGDAAMKYFECLIKDSWKIVTGQTNNPLSILECLNIHA